MTIQARQALLLKSFFARGAECSYPRPFIVIENTGSVIRAINVSSIEPSKLHKLGFPSNKEIPNCIPPLGKPSFAQLDEIYEFEIFDGFEKAILAGGRQLNQTSFDNLLEQQSVYGRTNTILTCSVPVQEIKSRNPHL
ncbi:hypothetical protein WMW72_13845 [Paenibacillus filicis]|uniref:Uncharacterized protein n=1 Tax=Paenibacillus filicis TaxID=669464 RepID=A0ABU9DL92_9BACL